MHKFPFLQLTPAIIKHVILATAWATTGINAPFINAPPVLTGCQATTLTAALFTTALSRTLPQTPPRPPPDGRQDLLAAPQFQPPLLIIPTRHTPGLTIRVTETAPLFLTRTISMFMKTSLAMELLIA